MADESLSSSGGPPQDINEILNSSASWGSMNMMQRNFRALAPAQPSFEPILLFFYGTLTIPKVLKDVLNLTAEPVLKKATIPGSKFKLYMWGSYPALVQQSGTVEEENTNLIHGSAYTVKMERHLRRLKQYETENYKVADVAITLDGQDEAVKGQTFVWAGYSEELEDGTFDRTIF